MSRSVIYFYSPMPYSNSNRVENNINEDKRAAEFIWRKENSKSYHLRCCMFFCKFHLLVMHQLLQQVFGAQRCLCAGAVWAAAPKFIGVSACRPWGIGETPQQITDDALLHRVLPWCYPDPRLAAPIIWGFDSSHLQKFCELHACSYYEVLQRLTEPKQKQFGDVMQW